MLGEGQGGVASKTLNPLLASPYEGEGFIKLNFYKITPSI